MEAVVLDCEGERAIGPEALADVELRYRAVLIRTGFARFWGTPSYFSEPNPFLTAPACELLVRAGALFVGIDSLNIDDTEDLSRPAHTILLDAGIPICEHMTNLAAVPASGGRLHAVPVAWVGGASFPWNPAGSKSSSWRAFSSRMTRLRSPTHRRRPPCIGDSSRCQSSDDSTSHSRHCPNSPPMKTSFLPGCAYIQPKRRRRLANFCQSSPGIFAISDPLPWTTSSCDSGSMKFSPNAYSIRKVRFEWWNLRWTDSRSK